MPDNFIHGDDEMMIVSYGLMRTLTKEFDEAEAEIARLRKIEVAARKQHGPVCGCCGGSWHDEHLGEWQDYIRCRCYRSGCNLGAALIDPAILRAALTAKEADHD